MKLFKKIAAIMLSIMMVLGMASVVSADPTTSGTSTATKGKITINSARAGQTYKIYKLLDLESYDKTNNLYSYKPATTEWNEFFGTGDGKDYVEINANGYVTWKAVAGENATNMEARAAELAQKALAYAKTKPIAAENDATVAAGSNTVTFDNLDLGYYLVESSVGALCGLTTTDNEVTIAEKNGVPSVEKKVQEDSKIGETDEWGGSNTADIGQTVKFQTTITAQPGAQNYVLHDKMDEGLTFDTNSVQIKLKKSGETAENIVTATNNYEVKNSGLESSNPCTFHIEFTQEFCDTLAKDDQIIVTYSATLNKNAVIAGTGNKNNAWLKYGDNNKSNESETTTYTFEIPVFKYTGAAKTPLAGAKFSLYSDAECTKIIELIKPDVEETYRRFITGDDSNSKVTEITTTSNGKFKVEGLDAGTYYLKETQQPDGYNKLKDPVKVVIKEDETITVGKDTTSVTEVEVLNNTGSLLPSTGGSGTTLIYILGAVLVLGSSVVLITKKRMR